MTNYCIGQYRTTRSVINQEDVTMSNPNTHLANTDRSINRAVIGFLSTPLLLLLGAATVIGL